MISDAVPRCVAKVEANGGQSTIVHWPEVCGRDIDACNAVRVLKERLLRPDWVNMEGLLSISREGNAALETQDTWIIGNVEIQ